MSPRQTSTDTLCEFAWAQAGTQVAVTRGVLQGSVVHAGWVRPNPIQRNSAQLQLCSAPFQLFRLCIWSAWQSWRSCYYGFPGGRNSHILF